MFSKGKEKSLQRKKSKMLHCALEGYTTSLGASIVKTANHPKLQILCSNYVFSSLKHGFHVLNKALLWDDSANFKSLIHMCFHEFSNNM